MIKFLIKSTNEVRIETKDEVDAFHHQIQEEADSLPNCRLTSWSEMEKNRKASGEIVEEWYIVKYTLSFNDAKDPENPYQNIVYNIKELL